MKAQFTNKLMASTLLWLDNKILTKGLAFFDVTGNFYTSQSLFNGFYTYTYPYNQLVADSSIPGATVSTGVYINNVLISTGVSGLNNIDYERGALYFTSVVPTSATLSGSFSVKEMDIKLTSQPEEVVLFETKHFHKSKTSEFTTGLSPNEATFPVIYLKDNGGRNEPLTFGGTDSCNYNVRAIVLADSQFQLDATTSILRDERYNYIGMMEEAEYPYNYMGGLVSGTYNYTGMNVNKAVNGNAAYIADVFVLPLNRQITTETNKISNGVFIGMVDLELQVHRVT